MRQTNISDLFQIQDRFLRSAHLERDFKDPSALQGYVVTPQAQTYLERLAAGLKPQSGQRVWRITGDYGSGKSSFGLVLAHLFSDRRREAPPKLRRAVDFKKLGLAEPRLFPVLITGSRESMSLAILRSLHRALSQACGRGRIPEVLYALEEHIKDGDGREASDDAVVKLVAEANSYIVRSGKGTGLLIILDELGKFLEYSALNPGLQDVYLLQKLAEAASRSGDKPLFVIGLLHQGFNAYAEQLSQATQREWEKVAGRFEPLLFDQPVEQAAGLIADALNLRVRQLPGTVVESAAREMAATLELGWYGANVNKEHLLQLAHRIYPLHPTVLPVAVQLFRRFGQNERSMFSFLLSTESFALQEFSKRPVKGDEFYRLPQLYDYMRTSFGPHLSRQSYRSHWSFIESIIESYQTESPAEIDVLKTVGILNMLNDSSLLASEEAIILAAAGSDACAAREAKQSLERLQKNKRFLYYRGVAGGYCLWPHTSVNLEKAYEDASRAIGVPQRVSALIREFLEARPVVARRHYIETGNLRHFSVRYLPVSDIAAAAGGGDESADGSIVISLCETEEERRKALDLAGSDVLRQRPEVVLAVPKALNNLRGLVQEAQRWQWVRENLPELNNDTYALQEVSRQIAASRQALERGVQSYTGLHYSFHETGLRWFRQGEELTVANGRQLLSELSAVCDEVYSQAPRVRNELINRRVLSSAAAGARIRLIDRMFKSPGEPFLGMDADKKPPEMSMYLSVLKAAGLHRQVGNRYEITEPGPKQDRCHLRPSLDLIRQVLKQQPDGRAKVSGIFAELRRAPFGVRDGLAPILLAAFTIIHEQDVAFYEDGAFMRQLAGFDFMRLIKAPDTFDVQYYELSGVRGDLFEQLREILELKRNDGRKGELLDVVRPLLTLAAQLPAYTHKTKNLPPRAAAVRDALLSAREPATLLFKSLPEACGFNAITPDADPKRGEIKKLVRVLKERLDDLRAAFPELQQRMKNALVEAFDVPGDFGEVRKTLAERAGSILVTVTETRLRAFCLRLADLALSESQWLESFGSLLCSKSPSKWVDADEELFRQELGQLADKFKRVEGLAFKNKKSSKDESAIRVAITRLDGGEVDQVIYVSKEEEHRVAEIEAEIATLLAQTKRLGLAATARAFWRVMSEN
jgi:hypothetical protein